MDISLLIPTMQNAPFLALCLETAFAHRTRDIEALVFSNCHDAATDLVIRQAQEQGLPVKLVGASPQNEGVCLPVNLCAEKATGDHFLYANDDFLFLPGWDTALLRRVRPREYQYLTPRTIEPTGNNPEMYAPFNFGRTPDSAETAKLLEWWNRHPKQDVISAASPAFAARWLWQEVGGFDIGYYPGFGHDPDFAMKIKSAAERQGNPMDFLGVGDAGIYHFQARTTDRVWSRGASLAARQRFHEKWGMSIAEFAALIGDGKPL